MHLLVGALLLAVVLYFLYRAFTAASGKGGTSSPAMDEAVERDFAFLSGGLLFLRTREGAINQLHSPYAQEAFDRRERSKERHSWKEGTSFRVAAGGGTRSFDSLDQPILATSATYGDDGSLYYFLRDDTVGGLFCKDAQGEREQRILLRQNLKLSDLSLSPDGGRFAASSSLSDGISNLVIFDRDGSQLREITGGDTIDSAPAWIPSAPQRLLFQSAGLARDERGFVQAIGYSSIQMLQMDTGKVVPVLDQPGHDCLKPKVDRQGNLLFIRRPYESPRYGATNLLLDTLLFPFRLLRALFHYLNFFSLTYTRKPLTTSTGPSVQADLKSVLLQGRRVDAEKALRNERPVYGVPSLVPSSWVLVRRTQQGDESILATNVASYDLAADGTVVYSNGKGVFAIFPDGRTAIALRDQLIAEVYAGSMT
jgi:WD40 repeat protein